MEVRLDAHDAVLKEHTEKYEAHQIRLFALEREVRDLRSGSRSPTPASAPPSRRGASPRKERNIEEELPDARGNHSGWFIKGQAFAKATGLDASSLQQRWETRVTKRP